MNRISAVWQTSLILVLAILAGCRGSYQPPPAPLSPTNLNLIFVASEDLGYQASGDVNAKTANLTDQGLRRALLMGSFLQDNVLGGHNVTGIYALEPMTHPQTANDYPDMVALETIQQFAMLNQITISDGGNPPTFTSANSYPIFASYAPAQTLPPNVVAQASPCPGCQGLDFDDQNGDNETLVNGIVQGDVPGFYVFSAPWETVSALMAKISQQQSYNLTLPARYTGPNYVYAISIAPSGSASLVTYQSYLNPTFSYPALPSDSIVSASCTGTYHVQVIGGSAGAVIPSNTNTNETVYLIRHAEAHPIPAWDDGNYVGPGQWRALDLPNALRGKIHPTQVYSIDPSAGGIPNGDGTALSSYVRPSLTAEPYAIANGLPFNLAASVAVFSEVPPAFATNASKFFFTQGTFSNQTLLVAWEHDHIPPTINALLNSYQVTPNAPTWLDTDYDSMWTVTLDNAGNLTVDNESCEGINSASLPPTPPQF
ncbi:MAG TPA: histidine phosphatase family protein [Candidatus Acidoferrales bacterium]|nr:histidine phosphatase family protein [Candidatus Acidoferrales bacterium]